MSLGPIKEIYGIAGNCLSLGKKQVFASWLLEVAC